MTEDLKPWRHRREETLSGRLAFTARLALDLQSATIHRHLRGYLPAVTGVIVDVGAGDMPYRHLVTGPGAHYYPLDTGDADRFDYADARALRFDGLRMPLRSGSVDHLVCTEVLEHLPDPKGLIVEMHRVLKPGGRGVITVPWSARCHYMPHDYHRFTPSALRALFGDFASVTVDPRGTDLSVIAAKLVVVWARLLFPRRRWHVLATWLPAIVLAPVVALGLIVGHVAAWCPLGSLDDPLGYTIWIRK